MTAQLLLDSLLCHHLGDSEERFKLRLLAMKNHDKHDIQHLLQLSDGWRAAVESFDVDLVNTLCGSRSPVESSSPTSAYRNDTRE
jgi:hypothetical protein